MLALGAHLITGVFKVIPAQALNVKVYLIPIGFKLDKKVDQTATCLCSGPLYYIFIQSWSAHPRKIFTFLEVLEKCYAKLFGNDIYELEKKPANIVALW